MRDPVSSPPGRVIGRRPGNGARETVVSRNGGSVRAMPSGDKKLHGAFLQLSQPVLLAVDDDPRTRDAIGRELHKRYGDDYRIVCEGSAEAGMKRLRELKAVGEEVAVLLAYRWMTGTTAVEFLAHARQLYPALPP